MAGPYYLDFYIKRKKDILDPEQVDQDFEQQQKELEEGGDAAAVAAAPKAKAKAKAGRKKKANDVQLVALNSVDGFNWGIEGTAPRTMTLGELLVTPRTHYILIKESEINIGATESKTTKQSKDKKDGKDAGASKKKSNAHDAGFGGMRGLLAARPSPAPSSSAAPSGSENGGSKTGSKTAADKKAKNPPKNNNANNEVIDLDSD